jgi:hypothetical protein
MIGYEISRHLYTPQPLRDLAQVGWAQHSTRRRRGNPGGSHRRDSRRAGSRRGASMCTTASATRYAVPATTNIGR